MNSEQGVVAHDEKKIDSSVIWLVQKIRDADTILLTSHTGSVLHKQNDRAEVIYPEMLVDGKINRKIIREQKNVTGNDIDTLISILSITKPDTDSLKAACDFDPHHAIFIIKQSKISYIDVWFNCCGLATSNDLKNIGPFGESKWKGLLAFFGRMGFKYELPETIFPKL